MPHTGCSLFGSRYNTLLAQKIMKPGVPHMGCSQIGSQRCTERSLVVKM